MPNRPIFIVGIGRSGTTLLRTILDRHSAIAIPPETQFLTYAARRGFNIRRDPDSVRWPDYRDLYLRSNWFRELGLTADCWLSLLPEEAGYRDGFVALLEAYRLRQGASRIGEKTPAHWEHLDTIFEWFDDACVIVMVRDPRAMVASQLRAPWAVRKMTPLSLGGGVFVGKRWNRIIYDSRCWRTLVGEVLPGYRDDSRVISVRYEDLVNDPSTTLQRVMEFVGEPLEPAMLAPEDPGTGDSLPASSDPRKNWRREHYRQSAGSIETSNNEKWRRDLSATDLSVVEGICGPHMDALGYETQTTSSMRAVMHRGSQFYLAASSAEQRLRKAAGFD